MCTSVSRRAMLGCGAWTFFALAAAPASVRRAFARPVGDPVTETPFARLEKLADGVWASVARMDAGDFTMVSNGAIVAGRDGVALVEGFQTPAGAQWLAAQAKALTGRDPTHVILTHFHGDHSNGLAGYLALPKPPAIVATATTRRLVANLFASTEAEPVDGLARTGGPYALPDTIVTNETGTTRLDLGGRTLLLTGRSGHTDSDLVVQVESPRVVWCGDLFFNGLFPYYGDAKPSVLRRSCTELFADRDVTFVPGHGPVATNAQIDAYLAMLDDVGAAAKLAHERGIPADQAWQEYEVPASMGEWAKFRPDVHRFAFEAWERELARVGG